MKAFILLIKSCFVFWENLKLAKNIPKKRSKCPTISQYDFFSNSRFHKDGHFYWPFLRKNNFFIKFSIRDINRSQNISTIPQITPDLRTFTEEIIDRKIKIFKTLKCVFCIAVYVTLFFFSATQVCSASNDSKLISWYKYRI